MVWSLLVLLPGISGRERSMYAPPSCPKLLVCLRLLTIFFFQSQIGDHQAGGYVGFYLDVPAEDGDDLPKEHELFVLADNRFNHTTAPLHTGV